MERTQNQKLKILYLMKIMLEKTDDMHALTIGEIIELLGEYGIGAERKSLYADFDVLREYGIDIEVRRGRGVRYYIANRSFELPELKLLVDAVQSSRFITCKKSGELIKKISGFTSVYEAIQLQRQVYVANRIKTPNESIYYNIDTIHNAIIQNIRVSFQYYDWTPDKIRRLRHGGKVYIVSPWALTWDDEYYYLIAYDSDAADIRHYRVDKMQKIDHVHQVRDGRGRFEDFDMAVYSRQVFGMFGGRLESIILDCEDSLAGVIIDRFGDDVTIRKREGHFLVTVRVVASPLFLSWVLGFGGRIVIRSPQSAIEELRALAMSSLDKYSDGKPSQTDGTGDGLS